MLCFTLLFRPGNLSGTQSNSESAVALAISSLDKNNFIHFPLGLVILKTHLSIVEVVVTAKAGYCSHRGEGISAKCLAEVGKAVTQ